MILNLDELHELVEFMKENGLAELEYAEKGSHVKLRLAPTLPHFKRTAPVTEDAEWEADEPGEEEAAEIEEGIEIDVNELMNTAKKKAKKAAHKAADVTESMAAYVKSRLAEMEEDELPEDEEELPAEEPEAFTVEPIVEEASEDAQEETSHLTRQTLHHAKETLKNTVKAGAYVGMAGARYGRERLKSFLHTDTPDVKLPEEEETDKE